MSNIIRIKRRASTGNAGAPSALKNAELAYNEADNVLYYGYGDDGSGNATSIIGIAGSGNNVTVAGTQTISGDKTFSGTVDLTGTFQINSATVTATAVELNYTGDLGTFTGTTIGDNLDIKAALQALESALEGANADAIDLRTMSGTADGDTDLGTFTGGIIADASTTKAALQALEPRPRTSAVICRPSWVFLTKIRTWVPSLAPRSPTAPASRPHCKSSRPPWKMALALLLVTLAPLISLAAA